MTSNHVPGLYSRAKLSGSNLPAARAERKRRAREQRAEREVA